MQNVFHCHDIIKISLCFRYLQHVAWKRDKEGTGTSSVETEGVEIRPLGSKRVKLDPVQPEDVPPSPEMDTQEKGKDESEEWPSQSEEDWAKEEDPWGMTGTKEAEDFWGVSSSSDVWVTGSGGKDVASSTQPSDKLSAETIEGDKKDTESSSRASETISSDTQHGSSADSSAITKMDTDSAPKDISSKPSVEHKHSAESGGGTHTEKQKSESVVSGGVSQEKKPSGSESPTPVCPLKAGVSTATSDSSSHGTDEAEPVAVEMDPLCKDDEDDAELYVVEDTDDSDCELPPEAEKPWRPVRKQEPHKLKEHLLLTFEEVRWHK